MEVFKNVLIHKDQFTPYYTGEVPADTLFAPTEAEMHAQYDQNGYQFYDWFWDGLKWIRNKWDLYDQDIYVAFPYGSHVDAGIPPVYSSGFLSPEAKSPDLIPVVLPSGETAVNQRAHDDSYYPDYVPPQIEIINIPAPPVIPIEIIEPERIDLPDVIIEDYPQPDESYPVYFEQPKEAVMETPIDDNVYNPVAPDDDNINVDWAYPEDVPINDPVNTPVPPQVQVAGFTLDKKTLLVGALLLILFVSRK